MGKHSHRPPTATMPYAFHGAERSYRQQTKGYETNLMQQKSQTFTSLLICGAVHSSCISEDSAPSTSVPQEVGRAKPCLSLLPLSDEGCRVQRWAEAQQKRNSGRRKSVFLLSQEESHNPDQQVAMSAGFVIQIRDSLAILLTKQVPLADFSAEQVNWKCVTRRPAWGKRSWDYAWLFSS